MKQNRSGFKFEIRAASFPEKRGGSRYDATTGAVMNGKFITGLQDPVALALSDDDLFIANLGGSGGKYKAATGAAISSSFITGSHFQPSLP